MCSIPLHPLLAPPLLVSPPPFRDQSSTADAELAFIFGDDAPPLDGMVGQGQGGRPEADLPCVDDLGLGGRGRESDTRMVSSESEGVKDCFRRVQGGSRGGLAPSRALTLKPFEAGAQSMGADIGRTYLDMSLHEGVPDQVLDVPTSASQLSSQNSGLCGLGHTDSEVPHQTPPVVAHLESTRALIELIDPTHEYRLRTPGTHPPHKPGAVRLNEFPLAARKIITGSESLGNWFEWSTFSGVAILGVNLICALTK